MQLGEVIGTVVATTRVPGLDGVRFLIVQPLDRQGNPTGHAVVAGDGVHMAAPGELVYTVASREAALAMPDTFVPVDDAIVGIVDQVAVDGEVRDRRGRVPKAPKRARRKAASRKGEARKSAAAKGGAGKTRAPKGKTK